MPIINIKFIKDVVATEEQKKELIEKMTDTFVGVLGDAESSQSDSFSEALLEHPHYTRPDDFRGWTVPEVLLSGNHDEIRRWRRRQSLLRTLARRPDLFRQHRLTPEDLDLLGLERPKRNRRRTPHPPAPSPSTADGEGESSTQTSFSPSPSAVDGEGAGG